MDQSGHESDEFLNQDLSAAIDNELNADDTNEFIEHLAQEPEMQRAWERHHTINALLRGEQVATKNHVPWEHIHASFENKRNQRTSAAAIISLDSLRERYLVKVVGGMALAASVVLGVSLFIAIQDPVQNLQVPLASESNETSESITTYATSEGDQSNQAILPESVLPTTKQPDVYLASDRELRQSPIPSLESQRQSRTYPAQTPKPDSDLVHLVSD